MENNDKYKLSTFGSLWRYIGIENHAQLGLLYLMGYAKVTDFINWCLYWVGLNDQKPPIFD